MVKDRRRVGPSAGACEEEEEGPVQSRGAKQSLGCAKRSVHTYHI